MLEEFLQWDIWSQTFLSNTFGDYGIALLIFLGIWALAHTFEILILGRIENAADKTTNKMDDAFARMIESVSSWFYAFIGFYAGVQTLVIHPIANKALNILLIVASVHQAAKSIEIFASYLLENLSRRQKKDAGSTKMAIQVAGKIIKGVLWVLGLLLILSNLGVNITSLLAGLGIGGVAVAIAAKEVLGDMFSAFVIYFDKPFVVGDLIAVGDEIGRVESIGMKATRIRSLEGEEIVLPNSELTAKKIQNYGNMKKRRVSFTLGIDYDTPQETLESIPDMVQKAIESTENVEFERSHFAEFGDSTLKFENVYYVLGKEFNAYRDAHEEVLFKLNERFREKDINLPFPTQTVYLKNQDES